MQIVPVDQIPKRIVPTPTDDLMGLYRTCLDLSGLCVTKSGIGLAATQVGIPWNLFVVNYSNSNLNLHQYYVDCQYEGVGIRDELSIEGCLSLPDRQFIVNRYSEIHLKGKKLVVDEEIHLVDVDQVFSKKKDGIYAIVVQHETDHGNLVLISDIGREFLC